MKRIVIAAILILSSLPSWVRAQEVETRPVSEDHKVWKHIFLSYTTEYLTNGDTLIADNQCYRLFRKELNGESVTSHEYYGAIFDEGKKTYFIAPNETEPQLILDFGVSEGDYFTMKNYSTEKDYELWVEQDTVIQSGNRHFRRLLMHNMTNERNDPDGGSYYAPGYWIEGVGSTASPYFARTFFWYSGYWYRLAECSVNGEILFRHPLYNPDTNRIEPGQPSPRERNSSIYDLSGRRIGKDSLPKGIYIQNGRKFVVR